MTAYYLALQIKYHTTRILKTGADGKSRLFKIYDETFALYQRALCW
jgi:hypothetical protein